MPPEVFVFLKAHSMAPEIADCCACFACSLSKAAVSRYQDRRHNQHTNKHPAVTIELPDNSLCVITHPHDGRNTVVRLEEMNNGTRPDIRNKPDKKPRRRALRARIVYHQKTPHPKVPIRSHPDKRRHLSWRRTKKPPPSNCLGWTRQKLLC